MSYLRSLKENLWNFYILAKVMFFIAMLWKSYIMWKLFIMHALINVLEQMHTKKDIASTIFVF